MSLTNLKTFSRQISLKLKRTLNVGLFSTCLWQVVSILWRWLLPSFSSVPIFLPQSFFRKLDSIILEFIWNKKVPRLRKKYLLRPKPLGGLALPNMTFYYWAATIRILKFWLQYEPLDPMPTWVTMEAFSTKPVSLKAVVHSSTLSSTSPYSKNVLVRTSLRIWAQFKRCFGLQSFSIRVPIATNHTFPPSLVDDAFSVWSSHSIISGFIH